MFSVRNGSLHEKLLTDKLFKLSYHKFLHFMSHFYAQFLIEISAYFFSYSTPDTQRIYYADLDRSPNSPIFKTIGSSNAAFLQELKPATNYKFWIDPYLAGVKGKSSNQVTVRTFNGGI